MDFIFGEDREQSVLLPDSIEDYISENSAVRVIDAYINSLNLKEMGFCKAEVNTTGRPMYDPKDILKLYVYGYMNRIRSSRRLETETKRNLEVIWLLRKLTPDHKTIARFRHANTKALKNVFCNFVQLCARLGLYGKELIAIDGSKFKAVNSKDRNFTEKKLQDRIKRIEAKIEEYLKELEACDNAEDCVTKEKSAKEIKDIVIGLTARKEQYQAYADELEQTCEKQKSLTDGDSRLMLANGKMDVCYNVQTAVDAKNKLIVEFEVTNQGNDMNFITPMALKAKELLEVDKATIVTDAGYESIQDITAAVGHGIDVHVAGMDVDICVPAKEGEQTDVRQQKNGRCVYIAERNIVLCPMGQSLYPGYFKKEKDGYGVFYNNRACQRCDCKCTTNARGRLRYYVPMAERDFSKEYNTSALTVKQIRVKADKAIVQQRKSIVEHPFGTIKRNMDCGYCLTRGIRNVLGEFSLTFLAYNIKRAINILGSKNLIMALA